MTGDDRSRVRADGGDAVADSSVEQSGVVGAARSVLQTAYRHDVHKLQGQSHEHAAEEVAGVRVNEPVPAGADAHAALLSRPRGEPTVTVANYQWPYRLSLATTQRPVDNPRLPTAVDEDVSWLVTPESPAVLHARWLVSPMAAAFNETVHYPYTSLRYHTLLVAALLDAYRRGVGFEELWLAATAPTEPALAPTTARPAAQDAAATQARNAAAVTPHRTVLWTPVLALHVTDAPGGRPAARLGAGPARSFGDVWSRLSGQPLATSERRWRLLDAQLRRIRSWSAALAYITDYVALQAGDAQEDGL